MIARLSLFILVLVAVACGGGGGGGGGSAVGENKGVVLNVNNASMSFAQLLALEAQVPGLASQTVTWSVTGGTLSPTGASTATYTSPSVAGTFSITARSAADSARFATCVVTVSQIGITIDPSALTLGPGRSAVFSGTVTGTANTSVNFTASAGTITRINTRQVTFTAPSTAGTVTIQAIAAADSTKRASAIVTVQDVGANASVTGQVRRDGSLSGVNAIIVAFYNASGAELARATSGADGRFNATVPISARRFHLLTSSLTPNFYAQYTYGTLRYTTLVPSCSAPLPVLSAGGTFALPNVIEVSQSSDPPPPPPNGCS